MANVYPASTYDPASLDDDAILDAFNAQFGLAAPDIARVRRLLGTREVVPWYRAWRAARAAVKQLPDQFRAAGLTQQEWQATATILRARGTIRSAFAIQREQAARDYDAQMAQLDNTEAGQLAATDSPIVRSIEAGYNDVPLAWLMWCEGFAAADRPWAVRFAVQVLRRALVQQMRGLAPRRLVAPPVAAAGVPHRPPAGNVGDWVLTAAQADAYHQAAPPGAAPL